MRQKKIIKNIIFLVCTSLYLSSCSTLTGIPAHGGGKRFATEQRLVSASIRASLKNIDVRALRGKKIAMVFDIVSDQGAGNMSGGRITLSTLLKGASVFSPVTATASQFQVFDLVNSESNFNNLAGAGSSATVVSTTGTLNGTDNSTRSANTTGSNTSTTTTTSTTNPVTTTQSGTSNGTNTATNNTTTTTGATVTTQVGNNSGTTNGTNSSTSTSGAITTNANTTGNSTNTSATNTSGNTTTTQNTTGASNSNTNETNTANSTGGRTVNHQVVSPTPSSSQQQTTGSDKLADVRLSYNGIGNYQNMAVPVSDARLLTGLVRNYLLLSGVDVTVQPDRNTEAIVYVVVDIFGTIRKRFDMLVYNNETLTAETSIEMFAFDQRGRLIMKPKSSNYEAKYGEHYVLWQGPFETRDTVKEGEGLLVDFSDVNGRQAEYSSEIERTRNFDPN